MNRDLAIEMWRKEPVLLVSPSAQKNRQLFISLKILSSARVILRKSFIQLIGLVRQAAILRTTSINVSYVYVSDKVNEGFN